jgi:hypothetical protein
MAAGVTLHGPVPEPWENAPAPGREVPAGSGDDRPTARLFLRGLGLVYLVVFGSLAVQIHLLVGSDGLLPVREFLAAQAHTGPGRFWRLPTLFWLWDGDLAVRGGTWLGLALGAGLALGRATRWCLLGCWALFLSYSAVGRDFFWFQWDSLLLETSVLALLLPGRRDRAPHPWVLFLFRWLLFRLLFESGLAKVQAGAQSWYPLIAMAWYYETAPLPSPGGWWAHQLPLWAHRWTAAATLLGELLAPLLIWGPRPARRAAFVLCVGFQATIQATANYGYFNLLSALLAVFLLDGRDLRRLPGWLGGARRWGAPPDGDAVPAGDAGWAAGRGAARLGMVLAAGALFLLSLVELLVLLAAPGVAASPALAGVRAAVAPWRLVSKYHLFAHIDPRRVEAEIEWSLDGQQWRPYHLRHKPGPLDRRPPIVAPHQPRVDFQLWFFTLGRDGGVHDYFDTLVLRLCRRPEAVRGLFTPESFPPQAPLAVRVGYWRYRMTDPATLRREGRYWRRDLVDYHPAAYFCDATAPPRF